MKGFFLYIYKKSVSIHLVRDNRQEESSMIFRKLIIAFRTKIDEKRPLTTLLQHCNDSQIEEMAVTQKRLAVGLMIQM